MFTCVYKHPFNLYIYYQLILRWMLNNLTMFWMADVPDSALIFRKHGLGSNLFSCLLFNELEAFNPRDQLGFALVRDQMNPKIKLNMFEVEVFEQIVVEYRHNLKKFGDMEAGNTGANGRTKRTSHGYFFLNSSSCQNYLLEMWGESHVWFCHTLEKNMVFSNKWKIKITNQTNMSIQENDVFLSYLYLSNYLRQKKFWKMNNNNINWS